MTERPLVLIPSHESEAERTAVATILEGIADVTVLPPEGHPDRERALRRAVVALVYAWRIRPEELGSLDSLRFVQSVWAGVDRIPVAGLRRCCPDAAVASGSGPNAPQVAEHALGLYLDCARRITWRDREMRAAGWPQEHPGKRVSGSRVAVVGYGHVGRRVARAFDALDASVLVVNRTGRTSDGRDATVLGGLHDRLGDLDGVVLAVPLTRETEGLVDRRFLEALPEDAVLVNVARGRLVVQKDLYAHLVAHPSFHAGLDVWWRYPKDAGAHRQDEPFERLPNVVMTPHSAFQVPQARREMVAGAVENVRRFLEGVPVENPIE